MAIPFLPSTLILPTYNLLNPPMTLGSAEKDNLEGLRDTLIKDGSARLGQKNYLSLKQS